MRSSSVIGAALLLAAGTIADSNAQTQTTRSQPPPGDRSFWVSDFTAASEVTTFPIEGVSLDTPFIEIREILTERGYEELSMPSAQLHFVKGRESRTPGQVTYEIHIDDTDGGRYLRFMRSTADGPISSTDSTLRSTRGLPSSEDVENLKLLKSIICDGIPDETEHWRLCPPNLDDDARLAMGRSGVTLVDGLIVEVMHATPLYTVIQIRRRP